MTVRFDDSLPLLATLVSTLFGEDCLSSSAVVRDAGGRLSVVLPSSIDPEEINRAEVEIRSRLGPYARPDRVLSTTESPGAVRLLEEARASIPVTVGGRKLRLLDRRIVGSDWLKPPAPSSNGAPRIIFSSLKGGVGRSTALCVLAAHMSRRGRRVLAIDLDLEAPGIGTMLLNERELPRFGSIDYLVENGLSGIDNRFMADMGADSFLGAEGARVTVVPAIGQRTLENPENALAKISRAYLEDIRSEGPIASLRDQIVEMVDQFDAAGAYDLILLDARAGLHEISAGAILGLGGDVLLFGLDEHQTFLGYRLLFAHLSRFPTNPEDDWRDKLQFVHAKATDSEAAQAGAADRFNALFEIVSPPATNGLTTINPLSANDFEMEWEEQSYDLMEAEAFSPRPVLHILDDSRYRRFDPISDRNLLSSATSAATFRELLDYADVLVDSSGSATV